MLLTSFAQSIKQQLSRAKSSLLKWLTHGGGDIRPKSPACTPALEKGKAGKSQTGPSARREEKLTSVWKKLTWKSQRRKQMPSRVTERRAATNRPGKGRQMRIQT